MARSIKRTQINDIGNLLIAGTYITIEANGRVSSSGGIAPNSNVEGNIRFTGSVTANSYIATGFGTPTVTSATSINLTANGSVGGAVVITNSPLRLRSYTTADRGNIVATAGDTVYNSTVKAPQIYNGNTWSTAVVAGPAFRAYVDTAQTIPGTGVQTKTTFGSETFDTNSNFANSTFTPTVEGYYQLNATVRIQGGSSTGECMITIWKNGAEYARGVNQSGTEQGASFYSMQVSDIAYANGTTDYFEIYYQQASGTGKEVTAGQNISYFSGCMIRGA
jgi:hypothetical protein